MLYLWWEHKKTKIIIKGACSQILSSHSILPPPSFTTISTTTMTTMLLLTPKSLCPVCMAQVRPAVDLKPLVMSSQNHYKAQQLLLILFQSWNRKFFHYYSKLLRNLNQMWLLERFWRRAGRRAMFEAVDGTYVGSVAQSACGWARRGLRCDAAAPPNVLRGWEKLRWEQSPAPKKQFRLVTHSVVWWSARRRERRILMGKSKFVWFSCFKYLLANGCPVKWTKYFRL